MKNYTDRPYDLYRNDIGNKSQGRFLASDVDFSIEIYNADLDFWQYKDYLYRAVSKTMDFKRYKDDNQRFERSPFEQFVRNRLKKLTRDESSLIFITDYSEREGSLLITFSFFIFTTFMNYGQLRESLDYIREDFNYFLRDIYPDGTVIRVDYNDRPNHLIEHINDSFFRQTFERVNHEFRKLKMIVLIIGIFSLGFSSYAVYKSETQPSQAIDNATMQSMIRLELDKINAEKTNEELLRLMKQQLKQVTEDNSKTKK